MSAFSDLSARVLSYLSNGPAGYGQIARDCNIALDVIETVLADLRQSGNIVKDPGSNVHSLPQILTSSEGSKPSEPAVNLADAAALHPAASIAPAAVLPGESQPPLEAMPDLADLSALMDYLDRVWWTLHKLNVPVMTLAEVNQYISDTAHAQAASSVLAVQDPAVISNV